MPEVFPVLPVNIWAAAFLYHISVPTSCRWGCQRSGSGRNQSMLCTGTHCRGCTVPHWGMCCITQRSIFTSDLLLLCSNLCLIFIWSKWLQCVKELNQQDAVCTGTIYCVCTIWASKLSVQCFSWNIKCLEYHFSSAHISSSSWYGCKWKLQNL